jgi:hypothetical protein
MNAFDYDLEAGLFSSKRQAVRQKTLGYRRFSHASEAIRFVIEDLPAEMLGGCSLEVDETTYVGVAIRGLYESADFPLPRRVKLST